MDIELRDAIVRLSRSNIIRHPTRTIASGVALAVLVMGLLFIAIAWALPPIIHRLAIEADAMRQTPAVAPAPGGGGPRAVPSEVPSEHLSDYAIVQMDTELRKALIALPITERPEWIETADPRNRTWSDRKSTTQDEHDRLVTIDSVPRVPR